tara:strand:- start:1051 stop:4344 length:3294 start_codon:yes stop_codon:yes gene_type:complete
MVVTKKQSLSSTHVNGDSTHNKQRNIKASTIHVDELQVDGIVIANGIITLPSTGDIRIAGDSLFSINPIRVDSININANAVITAHVGDDQITESKLDSALRTKLNSGNGGDGGNSGNHGLKVDYFDALPLLNLINAPQVGMVLLSRTTTQLVIKVTPPINHQLWFLPNDHRVSLHKLRVKVYDDDLKAITREYVEVHTNSDNTLYDLVSVTLNFEAGTTDTSQLNPVPESIIGLSGTILKTPASSVPYTGPFKVEMGYVSNAFQQNAVSTLSGLQLLTAGYAQAVPKTAFRVETNPDSNGNREITVNIFYDGLDHDLFALEPQTTPALNGVLVGIFGISAVDGRAVHPTPLPTATDITGDFFKVGNSHDSVSRVQIFPNTIESVVTFENVGFDTQFRVFVMVKNITQVADNDDTTLGKYVTQNDQAFSTIHTTSSSITGAYAAYSQGSSGVTVVANINNQNNEVVHQDEEYTSTDFLLQFPDRANLAELAFLDWSLGDEKSYRQVSALSNWVNAPLVQQQYLYKNINNDNTSLVIQLSDIQVPNHGTSIHELGRVSLTIGNASVEIPEPITINDTPWDFSGGFELDNLTGGQQSQTKTDTLITNMDTTLEYTITDTHANTNKRNVFIDLTNLRATVAITTTTTRHTDYMIQASYTHSEKQINTLGYTYRFINQPILTSTVVSFQCADSHKHKVCGREVLGQAATGKFKFVVTVKLQSDEWRYIPENFEMYKLKLDSTATSTQFVKLNDLSPDSSNSASLASLVTDADEFTFTHTVTKGILELNSTITADVDISEELQYFYSGQSNSLSKTGRVDYASRQHPHYFNSVVDSINGVRLELTGGAHTSIQSLLDGTDITANTHFDSDIDDSDYFKSIGMDDQYLKSLSNFDHTIGRTSDNSLMMYNGKYHFPNNSHNIADASDFTESPSHLVENRCLLLRYTHIEIAQRFVVLQFDTYGLNARLTEKMYMWAKVVVSTGDNNQSLHWNSVQFEGETRNTTSAIDSQSSAIAYNPAVGKGMRVSTASLTSALGSATLASEAQLKPNSVLIDTGTDWTTTNNSVKHLYVLLVCLKTQNDLFGNITATGHTVITSKVVSDFMD